MKTTIGCSLGLIALVAVAGCRTETSRGGKTVGTQVGNLAPEIEGVDLDGVPFKLSDYRGKVVVLDFWGDW